MTAQEARELSNKGKLTFEQVLDAIKIMAEAGHNYSVKDRIKYPNDITEYQTKLEELGYTVKVTNQHFEINW